MGTRKGLNRHSFLQLAGALGITTLLWQCGLPAPAAPTWDVDVNIPLVNKTYTIQELIEDTDELKQDSLGNISFEFETVIDTFAAGDQLSISGISSSFAQEIGAFEVASPGNQIIAFALREIYPAADLLDGQQAPVPAFNFDIADKEVPAFGGFQWMDIASGYIDMRIENDLPVQLGRPINVVLRDTATDTVLFTAEFPEFVEPGTNATTRVDLNNKRLGNGLKISITGSSPGSNDPVTIDASAGFRVIVTMSDLTVSGAAAKIDPITVNQDESILIEEDVVLSRAVIKSGSMDITFNGSFPMDIRVLMTLPDFVSAQGLALVDSIDIIAGTSSNKMIDISNYTLQPQGENFREQEVRFSWEMRTLNDPDDIIELNAEDNLNASFTLSDLSFSEITGKFQEKWVDIPAQDIDVGFDSDFDSLAFADAILSLTLSNTIGFPARTALTISGANERGDIVVMEINETVQPGTENGSPRKTEIVLSGSNSRIVELLNIIPTSMTVSGAVQIGDPSTFGTIRETDYVFGTAKFSAPLAFQLPSQNLDGDASELELDEDMRDQIDNNLERGQISARLNSHLPIGAGLELVFGLTEDSLYTEPDLVIGPLTLQPGDIDPATGRVSAPVLSELDISLDKDQLSLFTNPRVFSGFRLLFPGTGGQIVRLLATDYIDVQAYLSVTALIEKDDSNE